MIVKKSVLTGFFLVAILFLSFSFFGISAATADEDEDEDDDGIDDDEEEWNKREVQVEIEDGSVQIQSRLENGEEKNEMDLEIKFEDGDDDGLEIKVKYEIESEDRGMPTVFISDSYFVGSTSLLNGFEKILTSILEEESTIEKLLNTENPEEQSQAYVVDNQYIPLLTITISALADAVSPCSIAILVFLIGTRVLISDF